MSRYSPAHKAQSRLKLIEAARLEFRTHGFERASIDTLTKGAGLTRGAFYAHFASKEALVEEVLRLEPGLVSQLEAVELGPAAPSAALAVLANYLSDESRPGLIQCPLVAHPMDAVRGGPVRSELYQERVADLVGALEPRMHQPDADAALLAAVISVGAAILSRSVIDPEFAKRISRVAVDALSEQVAGQPSSTL